MSDWWVPWIAPAAVVVAAIAAGVFALINRQRAEKVPLPPTWPEMYARMDAQDKRIDDLEKRIEARDRAFASVLTDLAAQWPRDHRPKLKRADLDVLADTIPASWRDRPAAAT